MNIISYWPSLDEFTEQVSTFHFKQEDIDFQEKMALEVGYQSWRDYLKYFHNTFCNIYNTDSIVNELGASYSKTNTITGSLPIIINKHLNRSLHEKMQPMYDKAKTLPIDDQNKVYAFEDKMALIFTTLVLNKYKDDPIALELVKAFEKDLKNQFLALDSPPLSERTESIAESILMPNTNFVIQKYSKTNFYFPSQKHLLKKLHEILLAEGLIEANDDFEKTFEKKIKPANLKPTLWLADSTELFYLLYRLNCNKEYVDDGISIDKIANQLFTFKKTKTDNTIRTGFVKAFKQFEEEEYLNKKMSTIINVLQKLPI